MKSVVRQMMQFSQSHNPTRHQKQVCSEICTRIHCMYTYIYCATCEKLNYDTSHFELKFCEVLEKIITLPPLVKNIHIILLYTRKRTL